MAGSIVVTGGGRGVGRSIVERLLVDPAVHVVVVELDGHTGWTADHPAASRIAVVAGDAAQASVVGEAADVAEDLGTLVGWVNNAALFHDANLHEDDPGDVPSSSN